MTRATPATVGLVAGPLLLIAAFAIWMASGQLPWRPVDRVFVGLAAALSVLLLAPGALSLAWMTPQTERTARAVLKVVSAVLVAVPAAIVFLFYTRLTCRPVEGPVDVLLRATAVGLAAALAFRAPTLLAGRMARTGRIRAAFLIGAGAGFAGVVGAVVVLYLVAPVGICRAV